MFVVQLYLLFVEAYFCSSLEKSQKLPKIRTRKNFMPHGSRTGTTVFLPVFCLWESQSPLYSEIGAL